MPRRFAMRRLSLAVRLAMLLGVLSGSAPALPREGLPDLGDVSQGVVSPLAERRAGEQSMQQLRAGGGYFDDPEVNAYLNALGQRLVAGVSGSHPEFLFFAVGSSEINAFALPGGFVGVNTGLILAARSESELASVLAHEITHVTQNHIARQVTAGGNSQMAGMAALLAALVAARNGNGQAVSAAISTTMAVQAQSQINYTREHEREADRIGFTLLDQAGFDSRAMSGFFERLQQAVRGQEGSTPSYLRSHPLTHERVADAQDREASVPYRQVGDSLDFHLVKALLRSYDGQPEEAVADFTSRLAEKRYQSRTATRYGLAAALLRAKAYGRAIREIDGLEREGIQHPMLDAMAGQILQQSGQRKAALLRYERALARYPQHLQLVHDYPRTLLQERRFADVVRFAETALQTRSGDAVLHQLAAEAYARQGKPLQSHRHQGEYYAALGDSRGAIEQFELALRSGSVTASDTGELLVVETRLKSLRGNRDQDVKQAEAATGGSGLSSMQQAPGSHLRAPLNAL
jgi:predicted Zn-dependent protease